MFPEVTVRGCAFHWTQAVVRHIKSVGLWTSYQQENKVGVVLRDLLCLKYVPAEQTEATLDYIELQIQHEAFSELIGYMRRTWFQLWKPIDWSAFMLENRTTNMVEGWHNRVRERYANNRSVVLQLQMANSQSI